MDPFSMIQAGAGVASTLGTLFGGSAQDRASQLQAIMAQRQLDAQRVAAGQQYELATAGSRNARGDTSQYIPGVGWVETLSQQSRALQGASDAETMQRLTTDQARSREGRGMNFDARMLTRGAADTALRQYQGQTPRSQSAIEAAMIARNVAQARDPVTSAQNQVNLQALRSGTGAGETLAALSRQGAAGTNSAIADARLNAPQAAQEESAAASGNRLNQFNTLSANASNIDDVPFEAQNIPDVLAARASRQALYAPSGAEGASRSLARGFDPTISHAGSGGLDFGSMLGAFGQSAANLYKASGFDTNRTNQSQGLY